MDSWRMIHRKASLVDIGRTKTLPQYKQSGIPHDDAVFSQGDFFFERSANVPYINSL